MIGNLQEALKQHTQKGASLWVTVALAAGATALVLIFRNQITKLAGFGYAGAFVLALIGNAAITVPVPWVFPVAAMGAVYNPVWIALIAALGAAIGETAPYILGRRVALHAGPSGIVRTMNALSTVKKFWIISGSAFSPVMSYPGFVGGMMRFPVWATCAITLAAEFTKVFLITKAMVAGSRFWPGM